MSPTSRLCHLGAQEVLTPSNSKVPHPNRGGELHTNDHTQDSTTPATACLRTTGMVSDMLGTTRNIPKWDLDGHYCTWSGRGPHPWDNTPLRSVQQKWLLLCTDLLYLQDRVIYDFCFLSVAFVHTIETPVLYLSATFQRRNANLNSMTITIIQNVSFHIRFYINTWNTVHKYLK